jgi:hypothetical protein
MRVHSSRKDTWRSTVDRSSQISSANHRVQLLIYCLGLSWGFSLGKENREVKDAVFLGGNFAVGRALLDDLGGFDPVGAVGESSGGVGEETRLQQALLKRGVPGVYVAEAQVGHYIPKNNVTLKFALHRRWRLGYGEGQLARLSAGTLTNHVFAAPIWLWRTTVWRVFVQVVGVVLPRSRQEYVSRFAEIMRYLGKLSGYRHQHRKQREA